MSTPYSLPHVATGAAVRRLVAAVDAPRPDLEQLASQLAATVDTARNYLQLRTNTDGGVTLTRAEAESLLKLLANGGRA